MGTVTALSKLTGDIEVDLQLVNIRKPLAEAYMYAEQAAIGEPIGVVFDLRTEGGRAVALRAFMPGVVEEYERFAKLLICCVDRHDLAWALHEVREGSAEVLAGLVVDDPSIWNVALIGQEAVVATVLWQELLEADVKIVVGRARRAGIQLPAA